MSLKCGIVGLPNVGKSTLFNALTQTALAEAANYPFCTIEPNAAVVGVPDKRLEILAKMAGSEKTIPTQIEFVDIAGLVKGASKGEGLGNQFLSHIREVDAIIHVLRCFEDDNITHVEGNVDPMRDAEIVEIELILADLDSLEKRLPNIEKKSKGGDLECKEQLPIVKELVEILAKGLPGRKLMSNDTDKNKIINKLQLLTTKPVLYVCNVLEDEAASGNKYSEIISKKASDENAAMAIISSKIEAEIAGLDGDEEAKLEFLQSVGLKESGLNKIIHKAYEMLGLLTFFTVGPKEARAWTVSKGATAPQAAGVIHTDFEKGFIRAETIAYSDYINLGGETACKEQGKLRLEGKEYIVKDADIFHFRFNV